MKSSHKQKGSVLIVVAIFMMFASYFLSQFMSQENATATFSKHLDLAKHAQKLADTGILWFDSHQSEAYCPSSIQIHLDPQDVYKTTLTCQQETATEGAKTWTVKHVNVDVCNASSCSPTIPGDGFIHRSAQKTYIY